ncbi:MAG: hypothetical protein HQL45_15625 [Alphaproteobacteria bacterium]|nr:hypothetical protein [Alphaproteobacteria bacterium]
MASKDSDNPLLNPVLKLTTEPKKRVPDARSKDASKVVWSRFSQHKTHLMASCRGIYERRASLPVYGGRVLLRASMCDDSYAPTYTPHDLFNAQVGCQLVAPINNGYLVEAHVEALPNLMASIEATTAKKTAVDISRVEDIRAFDGEEILRGRSIDQLWKEGSIGDGGKLYMLWLPPYSSGAAREELMVKLQQFAESKIFTPTYPGIDLVWMSDAKPELTALETTSQTSLARAFRRYRNNGHARASVWVRTKAQLAQLVGSGAAFRVDAVKRVEVTSAGEVT